MGQFTRPAIHFLSIEYNNQTRESIIQIKYAKFNSQIQKKKRLEQEQKQKQKQKTVQKENFLCHFRLKEIIKNLQGSHR